MAYLLDANVFITARNLYYGFDFCPAYWDWLEQAHEAARVFSVEHVADELTDDELARWAAARGDGFFLSPDAATLPAFGTVADWVNGQSGYTSAAKSTFLQVADYYLIAQALAGRHTVVTQEIPENKRHKVKIPNVCLGLGVDCINTFDMLRRERARFVLPTGQHRTLWDSEPEGGTEH